MDPQRAYSDSLRLASNRPTQLSSGFTTLRHQQISDQQSPSSPIPGSIQERDRIIGQEKYFFNQRQKASDPMILKLLELVKEYKKQQISVITCDEA
ncbi:hypothetical protein O181_095764 [Austropuccinia psidii MF-1]|uniref:Uncharacterized protein n=1 Tax=Austropuccinia psidii MF-1 TaxID=1389203 RepID=A0A9Q3J5S7_9BASI|nr:hypothetical protein [Austropuccinia psidii MF-1]